MQLLARGGHYAALWAAGEGEVAAAPRAEVRSR